MRVGDDAKAYPFSVLMSERVVNDAIGTTPFVVLWGAPDTADAFSAESVENSKGVGTGVAFSRVVDGQVLSFSAVDDHTFLDVHRGEVVLEDAGWGCPAECSVGSVVIVEMHEPGVGAGPLGF